MAGFAANTGFRHRSAIHVGAQVVILSQSRIVTGGAHVVPRHAPTRPMSPLAGLAVLIPKHVKPIAAMRVESDFRGLPAPAFARDEKLFQGINAYDAFSSEHLVATVQSGSDEL